MYITKQRTKPLMTDSVKAVSLASSTLVWRCTSAASKPVWVKTSKLSIAIAHIAINPNISGTKRRARIMERVKFNNQITMLEDATQKLERMTLS
jgi:hypothetical protein